MVQFIMRQMTRVVVTLVISAAVLVLSATAQPQCPPGSNYYSVTKPMVYNGVCCNVKIEYCVGPSGSPVEIVLLSATVVDASCWGLAPGTPPPFSENYFATYLRDLVVRDAYPGTIPVCPNMLNVSIVFKTATCAEWKTQIVDLDGPGPLPEVVQWYLSWCSDVACVRECQVCSNTNDIDPCTNQPRLYFQCAPNFNPGCPGVTPPTNCTNLCGS
jgi:hypothetical protein